MACCRRHPEWAWPHLTPLLLGQGAVLLPRPLELPLRPPLFLLGGCRHGELPQLLHGLLGRAHGRTLLAWTGNGAGDAPAENWPRSCPGQ